MFMKCVCTPNEGCFTEGRFYPVDEDPTSDSDAETWNMVRDDEGVDHRIVVGDECFEEHETIYAICVKPVEKIGLELGSVQSIIDVDGQSYDVDGFGFIKSSYFEIVDKFVLYPNVVLRDNETGRWVKVTRVDYNFFNVGIETSVETFYITNFTFPVVDGSVASSPVLYCQNNDGAKEKLTLGKAYVPVADRNGMYFIHDDSNYLSEYDENRFSTEKNV